MDFTAFHILCPLSGRKICYCKYGGDFGHAGDQAKFQKTAIDVAALYAQSNPKYQSVLKALYPEPKPAPPEWAVELFAAQDREMDEEAPNALLGPIELQLKLLRRWQGGTPQQFQIEVPDPPKKPQTSYLAFFTNHHPVYKMEHHDESIETITRNIAAIWSSMSKEEKEPWMRQQTVNIEEYKAKKALYDADYGERPVVPIAPRVDDMARLQPNDQYMIASKFECEVREFEREFKVWRYKVHRSTHRKTLDEPITCVKCKKGGSFRPGPGEEGECLTCVECKKSFHVGCIEHFPADTPRYKWQCFECKNCGICNNAGMEDQLLVCDHCDGAFHTICLSPPLAEVPSGAWICHLCVKCRFCSRRNPGPHPDDVWHNEYTVCDPCWRRGKGMAQRIRDMTGHNVQAQAASVIEKGQQLPKPIVQMLKNMSRGVNALENVDSKEFEDPTEVVKAKKQKKTKSFDPTYGDSDFEFDFDLDSEEDFDEADSEEEYLDSFGLRKKEKEKKLKAKEEKKVKVEEKEKEKGNSVKGHPLRVKVRMAEPDAGVSVELLCVSCGTFVGDESPSVQCDKCSRWVHVGCDGIDGSLLSMFEDDDDLGYICANCRPEGSYGVIGMETSAMSELRGKDKKALAVVDESDSGDCLFCRTSVVGIPRSDAVRIWPAPRIRDGKEHPWAHWECVVWSSEVYQNKDGVLCNVANAVKRGQKLVCAICRKYGATIGCNDASCRRSFHHPCVVEATVDYNCHVEMDGMAVLCWEHHPTNPMATRPDLVKPTPDQNTNKRKR